MHGIPRLKNRMRAEGAMASSWQVHGRYATVTSYDPATYSAKVMLQPQNVESGWLPIKSAQIGNGWGIYSPPAIGDQVFVQFQEGGVEAGIITGSVYSDTDKPAAAPSGEIWLVHKSGASIKLLTNGNVAINSAGEVDLGNLASAVHKLVMDNFKALYNAHQHGSSGVPNVLMDDTFLTTVVKAN